LKAFKRILIKLTMMKTKRRLNVDGSDILKNVIIHALRQVKEFDRQRFYERM
jgi:hypothetical protein